MSTPPKPPERLAEILLEILALSDAAQTSKSESASGSDPSENFDAPRVEERLQPRNEKDNTPPRP